MARLRSELAFIGSFLLTVAVILNAFYHKKQFYPSIVYLTKSNSSMAVIYLQAFVLALMVGKLMNKIFFGQLRPIEMEHLFERSWYAITETCLAFTVFRDDFSPKFVTMFTLLLFLKCFHWLAEDRVDYMERSPVITLLFHVRILSLTSLLMLLDTYFVLLAYNHTILKGASVQLVFGFEYAILFVNILSTAIKYILHTIDLQNENPWENKGIFMLYGDLILGFFRVILYLTFMSLMIKIHTFPLFAIRPMYLSVRSFKKSLNDVIMSRRAIRNLNIMYPDVTPEQLRTYSDTICIICREEMMPPQTGAANADATTGGQIKRLPCDHIFHKSCLRSWFQRQQTCPTCRTSILRFNPAQGAHAPAQAAAQPAAAAAPAQAQPPAAAAQQPVNQQQPTTSRAAGAASADNTSNAASNAANNGASSVPNLSFFTAMFPPPPPPSAASFLGGINPQQFPLPPFAFMPPPLPPLTLSGLSSEELAQMEGNERHNVEARIHCLRNISVLLNTSMIQMQQYMNMCAATSHLENVTKGRNAASSIANDLRRVDDIQQQQQSKQTPGESDDINSKEQPKPQQDELVSSSTATTTKTDKNSISASANPFENLAPSELEPTTTANGDVLNGNGEEEKENGDDESLEGIRRRRLQHFGSTSSQQQSAQ